MIQKVENDKTSKATRNVEIFLRLDTTVEVK